MSAERRARTVPDNWRLLYANGPLPVHWQQFPARRDLAYWVGAPDKNPGHLLHLRVRSNDFTYPVPIPAGGVPREWMESDGIGDVA